MGSSRRTSTQRSGLLDIEPDYLLATLRRQFEQATGFAQLCLYVSPELEVASNELVAQETALFEAAYASLLQGSAIGLPDPMPDDHS